ncbi:hypothetical protein AGMMS50249_2170 [candidate division SR1 bacterium]|nr:hypothetical protein AGMMS50249_2170 [candidate division SR1 bacterium]
MRIFFKILRGFFLFLSVIVGVIYIKGSILFDAETYAIIKLILLPGYLICCGLIIGYLIATLRAGNPSYKDFDDKEKIAIRSFIIGIIIGIILAISYIFIA